MTRKLTQLGVAPPPQVNTRITDSRRPSGRYRVSAPDVPVGSVLRVNRRDDGAWILAELVLVTDRKRLFVDHNGEPVDFADWEYATRAEVSRYRLALVVSVRADEIDLRGAAAFAPTMRAMSASERRSLMPAVIEELRIRGKTGKASQVQAYLTEEEE